MCQSKPLHPYPSSATSYRGTVVSQGRKPAVPCVSVMNATATKPGSEQGGMGQPSSARVAPSMSLHQTWAQWRNPVFTTQQEVPYTSDLVFQLLELLHTYVCTVYTRD